MYRHADRATPCTYGRTLPTEERAIRDVLLHVLDVKAPDSRVTLAAEDFRVNPNYAKAQLDHQTDTNDDLALVLLATPAPASAAGLPSAWFDLNQQSDPVIAVGYGASEDRYSQLHPLHQPADGVYAGIGTLRQVSFAASQYVFVDPNNSQYDQMPFHGMIIASAPQATCQGDSGGPLLAKGQILVGVTALGSPKYSGQEQVDYDAAMRSGSPQKISDFYRKYDSHSCAGGISGFVNVASHLDWIASASKELLAGASN